MVEIHIYDIIPLIGIPEPPSGRHSYNISCPCCDTNPRGKHLNINLTKDVFCCPGAISQAVSLICMRTMLRLTAKTCGKF